MFCFFTKKQTGNVVGEKSRKGRGLIKHQGKNRANNRQDKVKHRLKYRTGEVIGRTGAAH